MMITRIVSAVILANPVALVHGQIECVSGPFALPGSSECTECLAGFADLDEDPSTGCTECPIGLYSERHSSRCTLFVCLPGTVDADADASTPCVPCPAGTVSNDPGGCAGTQCIDCAIGTYAAEGSASCTPCDLLSFQVDHDSDPATPCEEIPRESLAQAFVDLDYLVCEDDPTWTGYSGNCNAYANDEFYCMVDNAAPFCPVACNLCDPGRGSLEAPPAWQVSTASRSESCTADGHTMWRLQAHEAGWAGATVRIEDGSGNVQIEGFAYADNANVVDGVVDICLQSSRCYTLTVDGTHTASWTIRDRFGLLVAEGSAPISTEVCHLLLESCPPGTTDADSDPTTPCEVCPAGNYSDAPGNTWACDACPIGRVSTSPASVSCTSCGPGWWSQNNALPCEQCMPGRFSSDNFPAHLGNTECTVCALGRYAPLPGGTSCVERRLLTVDGDPIPADVESIWAGDASSTFLETLSENYPIGNDAGSRWLRCPGDDCSASCMILKAGMIVQGDEIAGSSSQLPAVELQGVRVNFTACRFMPSGPGVALHLKDSSEVTIHASEFQGELPSGGYSNELFRDHQARGGISIGDDDCWQSHGCVKRSTAVIQSSRLVRTVVKVFDFSTARIQGSYFDGGIATVANSGLLDVVDSEFSTVYGPAIYVRGFSMLKLHACRFTDTFVYQSQMQQMIAALHIDAGSTPTIFKVSDTTFDPYDTAVLTPVNLNVLAGCEQYPCKLGEACSYAKHSLTCTPCAAGTVGLDGLACSVCSPGEAPDRTQTTCKPCTGNTISASGFACQACPLGSSANVGKTRCDDVALPQTTVTDILVVADVLNSTNLVPVTTLTASVVDEGVLDDGSNSQVMFVDMVTEQMVLALGVDAASIAVSNVQQVDDEADPDAGRRRTQTTSEVAFDLQITGPDAVVALTTLSNQLANPQSTLRASGGITSEVPVVSFICPIGTYRPVGSSECSLCSDTSIPDSDNGFQSCKECVPGQAPDRETHSYCVCADNYYHSSGGSNLLKCYIDGEPWAALTAPTATDCLSCADTGCIDLGAIECLGGKVILRPGFSTSAASTLQNVSLNDMAGQRSIYACAVSGACLGDAADSDGPQCSAPYAGPLCDYCAEGYSRPGFTGECTECSEGLSTAWAALSAIGAVAAVTVAMYWVSSLDNSSVGRLTIIWPTSFRWFIDLLKVFSMDLLGFVNIGCVSQYTYTGKFFFAILLAPVMLLAVGVVYKLRKNVEGIVNRCVKMGLLTLFLIYPFVSQTIFQGFSCRQLDKDEEWLEVDFQISCLSDSYLAFVSLGMVGVIVYPIGIPTITLLQLWRNSGDIKAGGPGRVRYEFLVADYKPEFYYWDCLEMLRKAFITGILMFFKKGSLFQLVFTMVFCVAFLTSVAWLRPFASRTANIFKVGAEAALLVSLMLIVLLKIDLSKEDVPGGEAFVGFLLLLSNTALPGASLVLAILSFGLDLGENTQQKKKEEKKKEEKKKKEEFDNPVADDD